MKKKIMVICVATVLSMSSMTVFADVQAEQVTEHITEQKSEEGKTKPEKKKDEIKNEKKDKKTKKVKVSSAVCTSAGFVNIKLGQAVSYSDDLKITVADSQGNELETTITNKTRSLLRIKTTGLVKGEKYTVTIEGVKVAGDESFTKTECSFVAKTIKTEAKAEKIATKVRASKRKDISVKCKTKIDVTDNVEITVKDSKGKEYKAKFVKKSGNVLKIRVYGLNKKANYKVTVTGVKTRTEKNFGNVVTTFATK